MDDFGEFYTARGEATGTAERERFATIDVVVAHTPSGTVTARVNR